MFPLKEITYDTLKWGVMFVISKWISGGSLADKAWQMSSLYVLLGFLTYNISTRNFMDTAGPMKLVLDDWLKFGTMYITARLLSGASLLDQTWLYSTLAALVGFTVYDLVTSKSVKGNRLTYVTGLQNTIDDWVKFGTMFIVARLLSCQSFFDPAWATGCIGMLVGFSVFDVTLSQLIDPMSTRFPW